MLKKIFAKLMRFGEAPKSTQESGEANFQRHFGAEEAALAKERQVAAQKRMAEQAEQKKPGGETTDLTQELESFEQSEQGKETK